MGICWRNIQTLRGSEAKETFHHGLQSKMHIIKDFGNITLKNWMKDNEHKRGGKFSPSWANLAFVQRNTGSTGERTLFLKLFRFQELLNVGTFILSQSPHCIHPFRVSDISDTHFAVPQKVTAQSFFLSSRFSLPRPLAYLRNYDKFRKTPFQNQAHLSLLLTDNSICIWSLCWSLTVLILLQPLLLANYCLQTNSAYPLALSTLLRTVTHLFLPENWDPYQNDLLISRGALDHQTLHQIP